MVDTGEVARKYIEIGFWSLLMFFLAAALLAVSGGFFYSSFTTSGFNGMTLAFAIGALVGLVLTILVAAVIVLSLRALWEHFEHRKYIERLQADALLAERRPQPYVVQESPILYSNSGTRKKDDQPETINGVPEIAFEYFVAQICHGVPHSQTHWDKHILPGAYEMGSFEAYDHVVFPLVDLGFIVDRDGDKRRTGRLTATDKDLIMSRLREWEARRRLKA